VSRRVVLGRGAAYRVRSKAKTPSRGSLISSVDLPIGFDKVIPSEPPSLTRHIEASDERRRGVAVIPLVSPSEPQACVGDATLLRMKTGEKILYHQIHPLKLGTDVLFAFVSLYYFWQHQLVLALVLHFAPPIVASVLVIAFINLEPQRQSAFGQYVKRTMTHAIEAIRLGGDIVMVLGAWYHSWPLMALGLLIVIGAWFSGTFR
jgi:hypothetical protein